MLLFLFPSVEIGVANLKSSIISPHSLINHWYRKSESIPNSYRKVLFYTLVWLWTRSVGMQFTLVIEEVSRFIVSRWRLGVCCVWERINYFFLTQVMLNWCRTVIRLAEDHQGIHGLDASRICYTVPPFSSWRGNYPLWLRLVRSLWLDKNLASPCQNQILSLNQTVRCRNIHTGRYQFL